MSVKNYGGHNSLPIEVACGHGSGMLANRPIRILYDGNCPICRRKVAFLKKCDRKEKLCFSDIREEESLPRQTGIPMEQLEKQIHAVLPDGTVIRRMDVIRAAYREVGLGWLAAPTGWPVLRPCFDALYGLVAKYRLAIGRLLHGRARFL